MGSELYRLTTVKFGRYAGQQIGAIPSSYLLWMVNPTLMGKRKFVPDQKIRFCAWLELRRRLNLFDEPDGS